MNCSASVDAVDGFYQLAFTGQAGSGFGMLVFKEGVVIGADITGTSYDGSYTEIYNGRMAFHLMMVMPTGAAPVQTGVPLPSPANIPIAGELSIDSLRDMQPILIETVLGPVNIVLKKLRGLGEN